MNFVGKFDAKLPVGGTDSPYVAHAHVDSAHVPVDAIIVPDAKLLFEGDFKRSGVDLVLSRDGQQTVVHDYFKGEKRAALSSPDGAHLTGDIVNALAGHVEYAQASGGLAAAAAVVGHVTKLMGSATAIRNGVSIILNQGDNIEKGDVLQSGADTTLGVTFIDGTVFGLSSNARMVVNEMVYDPNGSNNSSLLSLVAGTISFVAGETAKHGDMKVDTPVATMGIRGTAVLVEIDFGVPGSNGAPSANFQVLVEPDGTTGSYILFDKTTLTPLATVNAAGTLTKISQGVVSFQSGTGLSPEEQKLITDVFQQKFTDNSNPKSLDHQFTDSITPQLLNPIKLIDGLAVTPVVVVLQGSGSVNQTSILGSPANVHIPGAPAVSTFDQLFSEHIGTTGSPTPDTISGKINFADVNIGDRPSVTVTFDAFSYQNAHQADISHSLTPTELAAVRAVETISLQADPGNNNIGSATWTYSYPDGAFDFLGAGETLTLTYTARVDNNYQPNPETALKTFTITITGTNDVPVITSSVPQTIAFSGGTSVPGGDLTAHVPTSGTITFDDPDLTDTHTVSVRLLLDGLDLPPAPLQIFQHALTASLATDSTGTGVGTVNWSLADLPVYLGDFVPQGQTITLTYVVTVTDSQGATSAQDITVTITGTDTPAVVWIATTETGSAPGELLWSNAANWETGTVPTVSDDAIVITNQLIGLTPSFPVIIDAPAEAKSLTMNDFGTTPPEVINQSTLTLAGNLNMAADSIIHNSGSIDVGGLIEVQDSSVLDNSGTLLLEQGGDISGQSIITNTGSIEIAGGTLHVEVDIANSGQGEDNAGGRITIDSGAVLALSAGSITGGTINDNNLIDVTGSSAISNADLNGGSVTIESGQTLTLDGDTVTGTGFSNAGTGSAIHVDGGDSLSLSNVTVGGGGLTIGAGALVTTSGQVTLTNTAVTNDGTIEISAGTLTITGSVASDSGHSGAIQIDSGAVLDLNGSDSQGVVFNGANAELKIDTSSFSGSISGLVATDEIDLSTIGYGPGTTATYSGGVLTLTDGSHSISMTLSGDYSALSFAGSSDGHGGTLITLKSGDDAPVFASADKAETATVHALAGDSESPVPSPAASGTLHFTDIDLTDRPTATVALHVSWANGSTDLSSSLTQAEISALENAFVLSQSGNTNNGTLGWTYQISDSALDFLSEGETAKVTATITVDDHRGGTDTATVTVTVDGAGDAPVAPTVAITSAGLTTSHANQTIAGTGEAGTTVTLFDNGAALTLPTITVDQSGHWSSTVTLANGGNSIVAHDTDAAGNAGISDAVTYTVDTTSPTVVITSAGVTTNHASQTIAGTGEAGTTVTLFDNGTALTLPTITVDQSGHWSSTVTLANGGNSIVAHDTDAVGNVGTSAAAAFTLDTTAPTVTESLVHDTGSSATDHITSNDALTGTGLANAVVHFSVDGSAIDATATADAQGDWSFTPAGLADGAHTVVASETDSLGNTGTATLGFTLDTTPPDVVITTPTATTNSTSYTISGTAADLADVGTTVTIYDSATSGGSISALGASLLTAGHDLVNGMGGSTGFGTQILATGDDNSSSAIDITSVFGSAGVDFFGHDYTSLYINNNGNITFAEPSGTYTPSSIDGGVNNPIIAPFWADVDTRGGAAATTPGGNSTGANQVIYNLDAANGVLTITWDDVGYYGAATDKLDAFQVQLISLGNGNFDIVYRYENINWTTGDASGGSDGLGGTPARAGYSAGDGTDYFELPESGNQSALLALPDTPGNTGIAGVDVFQVINGVVGTPTVTAVGTAIVQADGTWSANVPLTDGSNSLTAQDTDLAGNSDTSAPVVITVDNAAETDSAAAFQSFAAADTPPAHWLNPTSGDFADAANWSNGVVPAGTDDAVIDVTGSYTVTSSANETVHSIDLGANAILDIGGGSFTISNGGENDGLIKVEHAGSVLNLGGTVTNTGTIEAFDEAAQNAAPATVALNDAHISGGAVEAIAGGEISAASGSNSIDATVTIDADSSFVVDHGATVTVNGSSGTLSTTNDGTIEVQSGASAVWDGTLSGTGAIHIDNGGSFELGSASAAGGQTVTFEGSTGSLTLDHPGSFTGTIAGFTGDGTLSGSDQIDLKGIDYTSHSFSESFNADTDTLSVTDGTNSAVLHFDGSYQTANFSFTTDGHGGTIVYDPPVADTSAAKPAAVTADSNGFVFNFADQGHESGGTHPAIDAHVPDSQTFANTDTDPDKPHDDGHGYATAPPETMDAATIAAVKAQLHAHDFHFA